MTDYLLIAGSRGNIFPRELMHFCFFFRNLIAIEAFNIQFLYWPVKDNGPLSLEHKIDTINDPDGRFMHN